MYAVLESRWHFAYAVRQIAEVPFYISGNYYSGLVPVLISVINPSFTLAKK